MIDGVKIIEKKVITDDRGKILHMMRVDDDNFDKFGEIYFSYVNPNQIKAWHIHKKMTLNYTQGRITSNCLISSPRNFNAHEFHYSKIQTSGHVLQKRNTLCNMQNLESSAYVTYIYMYIYIIVKR